MEENKDLKRIEELEQKIYELENNWKRALADYKNLEKRVTEEREEIFKFANQILISKLIFIMDSLEMLGDHLNDMGLNMILKEFRQILNDEGLEEIEAEGKDFDTGVMEAIEMIEGEEGKVIEVTQKGYMLRNKVIRPAKVKVGTKNTRKE